MPKEYHVLSEGKVAYEPGFYEKEVAEKFAHDSAKRKPGVGFEVVRHVSKFVFEKTG